MKRLLLNLLLVLLLTGGILSSAEAATCSITTTSTVNQSYIDTNSCTTINISGTITLTFSGTTDMSGVGEWNVTSGTVAFSGAANLGNDNLTIASGATVGHVAEDTNGVTVTTTGNITVTGNINTDQKGCGSGSGNGKAPNPIACATSGSTLGYGLYGNVGNSYSGGGGAHGGNGGHAYYQPGGTAYDSLTNPALLGSSGGNSGNAQNNPGGKGGGLIHLVSNTLTINGAISANGQDASAPGGYAIGGGSGGTVYLSANTITGSGSVNAKGGIGAVGSGYYSGAGGGGRIAIYYATDTSTFISSLTAATNAAGGTGTGAGSVGTLYTLQYTVPTTPSLTAPTNGIYNQSANPTITSSTYASNGQSHTSTDWKITTDSGGSSSVWYDSTDATNLTSVIVNSSNGTFSGALAGQTQLASYTTYYVFVRHRNSVGVSSWSSASHFTTAYTGTTSTQTWDFNNNNYTYNSSYVEVNASSNSLARLKDLGGGTYGSPKVISSNTYNRMQPITITNNVSTTQTNFQVRIPVTYDSEMQADFDDIRFTGTDGTVLDYWLQYKTDSTSAVFWVEVPTLTASADTTIYMYYSNSSVSTASNGFNTFDVFDDFSTGSLDTSKWTATASTATVSGGQLVLTGNGTWNRYIKLTNALTKADLTFELDYTAGAGISGKSNMWGWQINGGTAYTQMPYNVSKVINTATARVIDGGNHDTSNIFNDLNPYYLRVTMKSAGGAIYDVSRNQSTYTNLYTSTTTTSATSLQPAIFVYAGTDNYIDNIRVRKYVATDPTVSFGSETNTQIFSDVSVLPTVSASVKNLYTFSDSATGTVKYQVGVNGTYYWFNGTVWTTAVTNETNNNTATTINQYISQLATDAGVSGSLFNLTFKGFLVSPDGVTQASIDSVAVAYDLGTASLSTSPVTVAESAGTATVTITASQTSGSDITFSYATADSSALAGSDYTSTSGTGTITAGQTSTTINIPITDDTADENDEVFSLNISGISSNATMSSPTANITITDNDSAPSLAFSISSQSVSEGAGSFTATVNLSAASGLAISVPYTISGTATGGGTDYTLASGTLNISAGNSSGTISGTINDDALDEADETVIITLGTPTNASLGATTAQTVTLTDNDSAPTATFSASSGSRAETVGTLTFNVTLSAASGQTVTVPYTLSGTATLTDDYTITASPLTFTPGQTTQTVTITTVNDTLDEDDETVIVTMGSPTNADQGATTVYTGTITDNDGSPTVTLGASLSTIAEGGSSSTLTATLSAASGRDVTVNLAYTGTATNVTDYTRSGTSIVISAGSLTGTATVTSVNDTLDETDETIIVDVSSVTNGTESGTQQSTVTIADDDATPTVDFTAASQSVAESAGTLTITAQLSAVSGQTVTIPYTITGTATSGGTDYSIISSPVTIAAGSTTADITVIVTDDALDENNETIIVTMGTPSNATAGTTTVHTATITDNDATPSVTFTSGSQTVAESVGTATITAQLSAASGLDVAVPYVLTGTAISGTDYTITASPVTITAGTTSTTITVTVTDDTSDENNETVIATMGTPTNASQGVTTIHTVTITDNDNPPTVDFSTATQSVGENAGTVTVTAQLTGGTSASDVTIPFSVTGTATGGGTDYSNSDTSITITAGSTTGTTTFTLVDDSLDEASETIVVLMNTPTNADLGTTTSQTITVVDNDSAPSVAFTASSQSGAESVGTMTVTAQLSSISGQDVTVPFTVTGTATGSGTDYTISASPITITAGSTTGTATITVVNDTLDENDETVILTMGSPTNASQGATTVHTATITDNDTAPTVQWTASSQSGTEATVGTMTVTAQLSAASGFDVTVPFTVTGTASGSGTDYTISTSPITITAGSTTGTATITVADDALDENNETVILTIGTPTNASQGATTVHTATITDDDSAPTVAFTAASQTVAEDAGTATITAQLSAASGLDITVPFTMTGTAANPADYSITTSPITISAGSTTGTITVTVVSDTRDETNETVIATMGTPTNASQGATTVHTVTITDDDATPTVTFTSASQSGAEDAGTMTVTAQLSAVSGQTVTVPFTVTGSATDTSDYSISASPITIAAGSSTGTATITVVNDVLSEADETVVLTMGSPTNATQGATTVHTATITDNDSQPSVTFTAASQTAAESAGAITITAQLSATSGQTVTIPYTVTGTATGGGAPHDYSIISSPVTIAAGDTTTDITIILNDDALDEDNETIIVTMGSPTNATVGATDVHTITITDNDATPTVAFTSASQTVAEDAGTATLTAQLSAVSGRDVTVPVTRSGTTTAGTDYTSATSITISAGSTTADLTVTVTDDSIDENNETAIFTIGTPTNATVSGTSVHTITITDNDSAPSVAFTASSQSGAESVGTMTVTAQLSTASGLNVTVPFTVSGSATGGGTDYSISASPITILAGSTTGTATITVVDDVINEANETVVLTIGTPTNASQGATTVHTATITDNDATPTVQFTTSSQSGAESVGTMTVTAQLSAASEQDVTVPFTVTGTSTGSGTDYTISASPITILAGATTGTATITVVDDALDENNETVILTIGTPTNATVGARDVHTATITDDDATPSVVWTASSQSGAESVGTMTVTAQLSAVSGRDVTVPYTVTGSATGSGTDYSISASPITISAGSSTATSTITVVDDALNEANETVILTIGSPTNATVGGTSVHTATITDNDTAPTVQFTAATQSAAESASPLTVTVQLSAVSGQNVTVPLVLSGTATGSGTDYSISATSITINAGSTTGTVTVTPVDDSIHEDSETVIVTIDTPTNASIGSTSAHTITLTDNDLQSTVSFTSSGSTRTESFGAVTVTATLDTISGVDVTVPVTMSGTATGSGTDYTLSSSSISIPAGSLTGTTTLTIVDDTLYESATETAIVTMGTVVNANKVSPSTYTLTITENDSAPTVSLTSSTISATEADQTEVTLTATASGMSANDITANLVYSGTAVSADVSSQPASITILAGSLTGTASFTVVDDSIDEDSENVIVDISAVSGGSENSTQQKTIAISDNDTASATLVESSTSTDVTEGGTTDTFTLVLGTQPTDDVTVSLTVSADVSVDQSTVTFTSANWNTPQTVTVTAVNDSFAEGNHTGTIDFAVTSNDGKYSGLSISPLTAFVTDNDSAGVSLTQTGGTTVVAEGGVADSYTLVLTSQPEADVTITVSPDEQVTTNTSSLTFTTSNWNVAQTVSVSAVNDAFAEGNHASVITHTASSEDANYNNLSITSANVSITDNDSAGVTTLASDGNTEVTVGGNTDTILVVLNSRPTSSVVINIGFDNQLSLSSSTLIFTTSNWNTPRAVTVTAVDNATASSTITFSAASDDLAYNNITIGSLVVTIDDPNAGNSTGGTDTGSTGGTDTGSTGGTDTGSTGGTDTGSTGGTDTGSTGGTDTGSTGGTDTGGDTGGETLIVFAGLDSWITGGDDITLNATLTSGTADSYIWTQLSGTPVTIENATSATSHFIAPIPSEGQVARLTFRITASGSGQTDIDEISFVVRETQVIEGGATKVCKNFIGYDSQDNPICGQIPPHAQKKVIGNYVIVYDATAKNGKGAMAVIRKSVFQHSAIDFDEEIDGAAYYYGTTGSELGSVTHFCDINGDGTDEFLVEAPGDGYGKIHIIDITNVNFTTQRLDRLFTVRGTSDIPLTTDLITCANLNGDEGDEIISGAGEPQVSQNISADISSTSSTLIGIDTVGDLSLDVDIEFSPPNFTAEPGYNTSHIASGDVNGDGFDDLVISSASECKLDVYLGEEGIGSTVTTLESSAEIICDESEVSDLQVADVTGDGVADIIVSAPEVNGKLYVLPGNEHITDMENMNEGVQIIGTSDNPINSNIETIDENNDGTYEIITLSGNSSSDTYVNLPTLLTTGASNGTDTGTSGGSSTGDSGGNGGNTGNNGSNTGDNGSTGDQGGASGPFTSHSGGFVGCSLNNNSNANPLLYLLIVGGILIPLMVARRKVIR